MPGSPYSDLSRPPLREGDLRRALIVPDGVWTELRLVPETGSTNADLADAARTGAADGTVLVAEEQTAGRGRLDRRWQAPARSSIMLSVLLRPGVPAARMGWLPLLAGVALAESVGRIAMVDAVLKWPNDLLVRAAGGGDAHGGGYGKAAGILAEVIAGGEQVVLGIGLNVSQTSEELPVQHGGAFPATSLALAGAIATDRDPLLRGLLRSLAQWYGRWRSADGDPQACRLHAAYRATCKTLGAEVTVVLPGGEAITGTASDLDNDGRLVVRGDHGVRALAAGDVRHVR